MSGGLILAGALVVLLAAVLMAFARVLAGPSLADRVVALDLMTTIGAGIVAVAAAWTRQSLLLDVALAIALVSFLGTVALARYAERRR